MWYDCQWNLFTREHKTEIKTYRSSTLSLNKFELYLKMQCSSTKIESLFCGISRARCSLPTTYICIHVCSPNVFRTETLSAYYTEKIYRWCFLNVFICTITILKEKIPSWHSLWYIAIQKCIFHAKTKKIMFQFLKNKKTTLNL